MTFSYIKQHWIYSRVWDFEVITFILPTSTSPYNVSQEVKPPYSRKMTTPRLITASFNIKTHCMCHCIKRFAQKIQYLVM